MKLIAPLPLCGATVLVAGLAWFALRDREPRPSAPEHGPRSLVTDRSLRERFLAAAADTDRGRRSARFAGVFRQLTAESAAELAAEFRAREKSSPFQNDWYDFLRRWTELDPAGALAFAETNAGNLLEDWLLAIVPAWAGLDWEAAKRWWLASPGPGREKIAAALIAGWADRDWQAAAGWVDLNSQGTDQSGLALALATRAVAVDSPGVQARIEARVAAGGSPTATEKALFLRMTTNKLNREFAEAIPWIASARSTFPCPPSIAGDCERWLMEDAARSLATNEARGAWLSWLTDRQSEGSRPELLDSLDLTIGSETFGNGLMLFTGWLTSDAESASQWVGHQQGRPAYDRLAAVLALAVASESPDVAEAWALSVKSELVRAQIWGEWQRRGIEVTPEITAAIQRDGMSISYPRNRRPPVNVVAPPPE